MTKCIFNPDKLRKAWGNNKTLSCKGKKYRVGKMSYGDYFLEPSSEKQKGETEGFSKETLWLEKKFKKNKYNVNQEFYEVTD